MAFRRGRIHVAAQRQMPGEDSRHGGDGHEATDRVSVVRSGWNWFNAHDAGGVGAFRGKGTTVPVIKIGAIERSAAPVCG